MSDDWWTAAPVAPAAQGAPGGDAWWSAAPHAPAAPPAAPAKDMSDIAKDVALSGASGFAKGTAELVATPVTVPALLAQGARAAVDKVVSPETKASLDAARNAPPEAPLIGSAPADDFYTNPMRPVSAAMDWINARLHKPKTTAGKFAETAGEFVPGALVGPGGVGRGIVTGVAGGLGSEAAGQAMKGSSNETAARVVGGLAGMFAPGVAARAITPLPATPARQALVATLDAEGVPLTAGQRTGSKALQYAESVTADTPLGGGGAARIQEAQRDAFTSAALRRAGIDAERATPDVMAAGRTEIGNRLDNLAAQNTLQMDRPFAQDIGQVAQDYVGLVPPSQRVPDVARYIQDLVDIAQTGGTIAGPAYSSMRSQLSRMGDTLRMSDPAAAQAFNGLRDALDNGMSRSVGLNDALAWNQARQQWGNLKDLERAAGSAGEAAAQGSISPAQLRSAVASGNQKGRYVRGEGDFADLARAGVGVMSPLPQSGTAPRAAAQAWLNPASAVAGAYALGPAGALAGLFGPAMMSRAIMSRPVQAYLGNQAFKGAVAPNVAAASPLVQMFGQR